MSGHLTVVPSFLVAMTLLFSAPVGSARQLAEPVKKTTEVVADGSKRQAFSVVLLLGDMQGGESLDGVPNAARKALIDTKDFLPYKNYRLLDSQWTLCCSGTTSAITRLRGLDDQQYELELRATPVFGTNPPQLEPGALSVRFLLRELLEKSVGMPVKSDQERTSDAANKDYSATKDLEYRIRTIQQELFALERERTDLANQVVSMRKRVETGTKDPAELKRADDQLTLVTRRIRTLTNELDLAQANQSVSAGKVSSGSKAVIDTSFRMEVGETVVVGTSGLRGGSKALIALLTAVTPPKGR